MASNVLFLMVDQMQGRILDPDSPCRTPNLDRLAERGVRFTRATTANPVCSPARASLMTGLLPHNHGVTQVTHTDPLGHIQLCNDRPHWAQRLTAAGYRTAYFGKWHVEQTEEPQRFGWQTDVSTHSQAFQQRTQESRRRDDLVMAVHHDGPLVRRPARDQR